MNNEVELHSVITAWIAVVCERQTLVAADISRLKSGLMIVLRRNWWRFQLP